eukprot:scaffold10951_cov75-Skeletonema_dohrnii-CCMP3373.AAC.2
MLSLRLLKLWVWGKTSSPETIDVDVGRGRGRGHGKRSSRLFRSSVAAWDEYFEDKVMLNPQEIVNVKLDEEITIPAGGTVSVYVLSKKGISYKASDSYEFE